MREAHETPDIRPNQNMDLRANSDVPVYETPDIQPNQNMDLPANSDVPVYHDS